MQRSSWNGVFRNICDSFIFSPPVQMYCKRYNTIHSKVGGISNMFEFYIKVIYVMGKVISSELSYTCCDPSLEPSQ